MGNSPWPALVVTIAVGLIPLILWYLRRHDSVAVQMRDTIALVTDMKTDLYNQQNWMLEMSAMWNRQQRNLFEAGTIDKIVPAPPMPELKTSQHGGSPAPAPTPS